MALQVGTRLGAYEIVGGLGAGGMGEVYRATDTKLGRDVAIKTLPATLAKDSDRLARFDREAKLLAALNHAHIGAIYGLDEHEGAQYLVMELVEGETLEEKLEQGALGVEEALRLALQIAEGLEAAHEKGVVHRDLKPANIMVTRDDQVKVLDFGLAKAFSGDPNEASPLHSPALSLAMTQQGLILGTAGYMSPEQASGQATDQRADIWAFGVVLYEMLTGLPLFSGESVPHILADVLRAEPDWNRLPKNLHPRVKLLLERCLKKKVRDRYHSIADVRVDIEEVLKDPQGVVVPQAATQVAVSARSRAARAMVTVIATGVVAASAAWAFWPTMPPRPVNRFYYDVPKSQAFRSAGRPVMAFSPDGRRFVYNTAGGLYLRSMGELEARLIPGTEEALTNPFFSPDGQSVAYWTSTGQLKRIAISGGAPVVIADGVINLFGASWGSDGTILYGQPQGIFRVSANGGKPELVIPVRKGERLYGPELLPDGDSVLFSTTTTGRWDEAQIVAQSLSTGQRTVLVKGGSDAHYVAGRLIYALGDGLFGVAFDLKRLSVSGGAVPLVQGVVRPIGDATATANYGISKDGTLVYVAKGEGEGFANQLVWVDREGHEEPTGLKPCVCLLATVSPDGTRVALAQFSGAGQNADIWVGSLTQPHTFTRLTFEPGPNVLPFWTPDGKRIIYASPTGLYWRLADGTGKAEELLEGSGLRPWAWTPDGDLLFVDPAAGSLDIGAVATSGDHKRRSVLATKFNERRPALSPDGHWLAYQSDENGRYEVYIRPYPNVDDGKWQVSSDGGEEPHWSGDGHTLFFLGPKSFMVTTVTASSAFDFAAPKAVLDRGTYVLPNAPRRYDVSPDGKRLLLFKATAGTGAENAPVRIVVVTDWLQVLKRLVPSA